MVDTTATAAPPKPKRSNRPDSIRLLLNNQLATGGLVVFALILLVALAAPLLPLPDPDVTEPANRFGRLVPLTQRNPSGVR